jgi:hypothetical protein
MKRDTESTFLENISVSKRGIVKTAASMLPDGKEAILTAQDVEKALRAFDKSPDVSKSTLSSFKERAKIDLNPESVVEDFFGILVAQRNDMQKMSIMTAMSYRQAGIFKVAGRDVYEDLETGDFWKISEDKKHVMRLFKENEDGISDKRAAKKQQYDIMGETPGDGGVVEGESFDDAVATFFEMSGEAGTKAEILEEIKKRPGKKVNDTTYQYGDYEVKLVKSAGVEPGVPDGTGPNPDCPCKKKDDEDSKEAAAENFEDSVDFTSELDKVGDLVGKIKNIISTTKWKNYMKLTDENYNTQCSVASNDLLNSLQAYDELLNEIGKAK